MLTTALSGTATCGMPRGVASVGGRLLSSLPPSSDSPLLCRGDGCKMASMSRLFFFASTDEDACFRFAFFQSFRLLRAALAFSKFQLGRPLRSGEAKRVEHPVPSSPAKMTDEGFVLVP